MTLIESPATAIPAEPHGEHHAPKRTNFLGYLTTTSHKDIGVMYTCTSFFFFILAGLMAELMRSELARPGLQFLSNEQYNQLFTMHGTLMMFLFAPALTIGGGTSVVQRNIIAERVLGLPHDVDVEQGKTWVETRRRTAS